jgi:hypothetical protein
MARDEEGIRLFVSGGDVSVDRSGGREVKEYIPDMENIYSRFGDVLVEVVQDNRHLKENATTTEHWPEPGTSGDYLIAIVTRARGGREQHVTWKWAKG